jgi:hypothetical protein
MPIPADAPASGERLRHRSLDAPPLTNQRSATCGIAPGPGPGWSRSGPAAGSGRVKLLEGALVKVPSVASKLTTLSAQDMIKAMIAGERDPQVLAALPRGRMKAKHDDLVQAAPVLAAPLGTGLPSAI